MAQSPSTMHSSSTPIIEKLVLTTCVGSQLDITPQLNTFTIFEDMFYPCLTGEISVTDAIGMLDQFPISGNETLHIRFYSYDYSSNNNKLDYLDRTFDVLKVTNITQINHDTKTYTLHFASPELKMNELIKISKSYQMTSISQVIATIMTTDYDPTETEPNGLSFPTIQADASQPTSRSKFLTATDIEANYQQLDDNNAVELFVEKTKYVEPFITIPYSKPFDIISTLAARSIRHSAGRFSQGEKNEAANFVFFENKRGYQFTAIESLIENKDNIQTLKFSHLAQGLFQQANDRNIIEKLEVINLHDVMTNIHNGTYASRLVTYDMSTGELLTNDYDYNLEFANTESMETEDNANIKSYPLVFTDPNGKSNLTNKPFSRYTFAPTIIQGIDILTSAETQRINDSKILVGTQEYLQKRLSQLGRLNTFNLMLQVSGNSTFKVGDMVNLDLRYMPSFTGDAQAIEKQLKYYSGNYLITAIKHIVSFQQYKMIIEVSKDSFLDKIGSLTQ